MGKNWAIVIGINHYDNLQPLKYAQQDAEAMQAWFEQQAKFDQVFLFTEHSPPIRQANPSIGSMPILQIDQNIGCHCVFISNAVEVTKSCENSKPGVKPPVNSCFTPG